MKPTPDDPSGIMPRAWHPFWQAAHRPLFLFAALWAPLAPAVWLLPAGIGPNPVSWHAHELLFGMGGAAVGGYLLTALPNWTGRGPVSPRSIRALALLWLLARLSLALAGHLPFGLLLAGALAYFVALSAVLGGHILAARTRRKAGLGLTGLALAGGDALFLANWFGSPGWASAPLLVALAFAFLISLIGGRAVPAFTQSWLDQTKAPASVRDSRSLSLLALSGIALSAALAFGDAPVAAGLCLIGAGAAQIARMAGWQSLRARRSLALFMLHLAWAWLPLGLLLVGLALARPDLMALPTALHALTMGAMGTMILAIMGRAAMARQGGTLMAGRGLAIAFALVWLAALLRVLAPFTPPEGPDPIRAAALLWMLGWALFLCAFGPALRGPVPRPVLGAPRRC